MHPSTHEVVNPTPPLIDYNLFTSDAALAEEALMRAIESQATTVVDLTCLRKQWKFWAATVMSKKG